jgi:hypothetical protein
MRYLTLLFTLAFLAAPQAAVAKSTAYSAGRIFGYIVILALIVLLVMWVMRKARGGR